MKTLTIHLFEILACSGALLGLYILVIERRVRSEEHTSELQSQR